MLISSLDGFMSFVLHFVSLNLLYLEYGPIQSLLDITYVLWGSVLEGIYAGICRKPTFRGHCVLTS